MASDAETIAALFGTGVANNTGSADINAFEKSISGNDIYRMAQAPILNARFNTATWSPGEKLATSAIQAFLGSALGALAQRDEANQLSAVAKVLPQLYANPSSVSVPEGVDPEAFGGLQLSAMSKQNAINEEIRKAFATTYGGAYNPLSGVTEIPGAQDVMSELFTNKNNAKAKSATGNRAQVSVAQQLGQELAAEAAINDAKQGIQSQFGARTLGADSSLGGIIDYLGALIPGTNAYQYKKDLPSIADPLTQGLTGGKPSIASLNKTYGMLQKDFGQPASSQISSLDANSNIFADKISQGILALQAAGWPETGNPVDANGNRVPNLTEIRNQYQLLKQGAGLKDLGLDSPTLNAPSMDINSFIAQAKAQGLSKEEAQAKWEGMQR